MGHIGAKTGVLFDGHTYHHMSVLLELKGVCGLMWRRATNSRPRYSSICTAARWEAVGLVRVSTVDQKLSLKGNGNIMTFERL